MDPRYCRTTYYYHFHFLETLLSSHFLATKRPWFHLLRSYAFFHKYLDINSNNCKKENDCNTQICRIAFFIHYFMPKWPLCRICPIHRNLPKNSQSNDTKLKTADSYSTGLTLFSWFFSVDQNWKLFLKMFINLYNVCC